MKTFLVTSLLFLFLSSSNIVSAQDDDSQLTIVSEENGMNDPGMVVGTISIIPEGRPSGSYHLYFFRQDSANWRNNTKNRIAIKTRRNWKKRLKPDYWEGNKAVYVFVWKRDEGEYAFKQINFLKGTKHIGKEVDMPFTLSKKNITYFGEIEINERNETVTVSGKSKRDLQLIRKKYPNSKWGHYKNGDMVLTAL